MPATVVEVTGTICNADGSIPEGEVVRATVRSTEQDQGGQVGSGTGITSDPIEAHTDETGAFSICLVAGATVLLEIPGINLRKEILVPSTGPVDFTTLV